MPRHQTAGRTSTQAVAALILFLLLFPLTAGASTSGTPRVAAVTAINGNQESFMPGVTLAANLDGAAIVLGSTRYDPDGPGPQLVFNDTRAGFLWQAERSGSRPAGSPAGHLHIFRVDPPSLYFTPSWYSPAAIADNGRVVGSAAFFETLSTRPWAWTPADGLTFLALPDQSWQGSALGESADGSLTIGRIFQRVGVRTTSIAAEWRDHSLSLLGLSSASSQANAISRDGSVVVGASGPDALSQQAVRWVNGVLVPLEPLGVTSAALFTSADGQTAVGTATLSPSSTELVRWGPTGAADALVPPTGYSIDRITAVNPTATAIVGSVVSYPTCTPGGPGPICAGNDAPFLWTSKNGFTVLPENGLSDFYDTSTATAVSDDGTEVIGDLSSGVQFDGSPKPSAFVWTAANGEIQLNTLTSAAGYNYDLFGAVAISGSGRRIVATGVVDPPTIHDTSSVILDVEGLG